MDASRTSAPLVFVCLVICAFTAVCTVRQLSKPWPIHQWESGLIAEAHRAASGLPLYEPASDGHATHMYGPAVTWLLAWVFRVTGPTFLAGRLVSLLSLAGIFLLLFAGLDHHRSWRCRLLALTGLAAFGPCVLHFVEPRPDLVSLLLATGAVMLMCRAWLDESRTLMGLATALTIGAMLFKQPAAMAAGVPIVAALLDRHQPVTRRRLAICWWPLAGALSCLAVIAWTFPMTFHYTVRVPASYDIVIADLAGWLPLLGSWVAWLIAALFLIVRQYRQTSGPGHSGVRAAGAALTATSAQTWALSSLIVTIPCCLITASKTGGHANCLLPAVAAAAAVLLTHSRTIEEILRGAESTRASMLSPGLLFSITLLASFGSALFTSVRPDVSYGDEGFAEVVRAIESTGGPVASPQDAAALVFAGRRPGRSLILEYDAAGWPAVVPAWFFDELDPAVAVVTVGINNDWRTWPLSGAAIDDLLTQRGFTPNDSPLLKNSVYRIWVRRTSPVPSDQPTAKSDSIQRADSLAGNDDLLVKAPMR